MYRISGIARTSSLGLRLPALLLAGLVVLVSITGSALAQQQLKVVSGGHQLTTYGSAFPAALVVAVTDKATGAEVPGVWVQFTPSAAIGLSASSVLTDEHGLASVNATGLAACLAPCTAQVTAEITGYPGTRIQLEGLAVEKATLTIVPADLQSTEGTLPPISEYEIRGFLNGDTPESAGVTGDPVLSTTASETSPAANYAIKGGIGSLYAPNYTFVAGFGVLAVFDGPGSAERRQEELRRREEAARALAAEHPEVGVRPAIDKQTPESASNAASRKGSGVFVRTVIHPRAPAAAATAKPRATQTALSSGSNADSGDAGQARRKGSAVIRTAILPVADSSAAIPATQARGKATAKAQTRSVLPSPSQTPSASKTGGTATARESSATVRSVLTENSASAPEGADSAPPHPQQTIRRAFNPPATQ